jgi:tellurite resistance protein TerC
MDRSFLAWILLVGALLVFLWVDLRLFARGREPRFREAASWSIGWIAVAIAAAGVMWLVAGGEDALVYTTVYVIERSLSLDNLVVFILLFSYFGIGSEHRARLLFWGIAAALVLRGLAILGGVALIEEFEPLLYVLGVALLWLAYRMFRGVEDNVSIRSPPRTAAGAGSWRSTGAGTPHRSSCAWWPSSSPIWPLPSTRSPPPSPSPATAS